MALLMYQRGAGVDKDLEKARYWYTEADVKGDLDGTCQLGLMYRDGTAGTQDYSKAKELFDQGIQGNNACSYGGLALLYYDGQGV
ncbi:sel1 repeat family protein, partial [Salmonella enterica subsp. enterica serovar Enteritidis]|nr:sel1 repeat family protein [Salmonella enterica subsp. enterica serovar Enteritidis]